MGSHTNYVLNNDSGKARVCILTLGDVTGRFKRLFYVP